MASALRRALAYDRPVRRRGRQIGRLAAAAAQPGMYPRSPVARAFWFDGIPNFGDGLTPWLLLRLGVVPIHASASTANFVGVGSVLEMLPRDFPGAVWGSGSLSGQPLAIPHATFLAVRGESTRDLVNAPSHVALGDPGILSSRFMRRPRVRWRVGIVPHHVHERDPLWAQVSARRPAEVRVIDVRRGPSAVVKEIAACQAIVTTSLHGLITADAFGIPAVWTSREPDLWGGTFKFHDYESVFTPARPRQVHLDSAADVEAAVRRAGLVDSLTVKERQSGLIAALKEARLPVASPVHAARHLWQI